MKKVTRWFRKCTSTRTSSPDPSKMPGDKPTLPPIPDDMPTPQPPALIEKEKYHVFISNDSEDQQVSEELRDKLESYGFKVFHTDRDALGGDNIYTMIVNTVDQSRRVISIVSQDMLDSNRLEFEFANTTTKGIEKEEVIFIPILHKLGPDDVPPYVKENNCYLEIRDENPMFWRDLFRLLTESVPLTTALPSGNAAHGIAWSHYYGYLSQILPGIRERTYNSELVKGMKEGTRVLAKVITILPKTCNCPPKIQDLDESISVVGTIKFKASRAGKLDRGYDSTVYKITDPENKEEFYALLECPNTLSVLYAMQMGRIADMDEENKQKQAGLFKEKMLQITNHPCIPQCHDRAVFIPYDDSKDNITGELSRELLKCIRSELAKEKDTELAYVPEVTPVSSESQAEDSTAPAPNTDDLPALKPIPDDIVNNTEFAELEKDHYHVYVSANSEDRDFARHLKSEMKRITGLSCYYPEDDALGGESKFNDTMDRCSKVITLVSEKYLTDSWSEFERINTISKSCEEGWKVTIPILHKIKANFVPPYVREVSYLETCWSDFWPRLVKALQLDRIPLTASIPTTDIVDGLAWAYYYNYLGIVLPGLGDRLMESKYHNNKDIRLLKKFIILLPTSGYCAKNITTLDNNITYEERLKFKKTTSGSVKRDYGTTVHKIKDPDSGEEFYIVMEYATPMWTMYEMEMGRLAGLSPLDKQQQMDEFTKKLKDILNDKRSGDCRELFITLDYNDQDPKAKDDAHHLSRAVMPRVRQELGL